LAVEELQAVNAELRNSLTALRNAARLLQLLGNRDSRLSWVGGVLDRQVNRLVQMADKLGHSPPDLEASPAAQEQAAAVASPLTLPALAPHRILVVDDNVDAAESLGVILTLAGHVVLTAYDGPAALAGAQWFHPDVVCLDLELPGGMDGWEVARRLRRGDLMRREQIIAITGFDGEEWRQRLAELERLLARLPARAQ
jgi:CheY-like chemotaxis protein